MDAFFLIYLILAVTETNGRCRTKHSAYLTAYARAIDKINRTRSSRFGCSTLCIGDSIRNVQKQWRCDRR